MEGRALESRRKLFGTLSSSRTLPSREPTKPPPRPPPPLSLSLLNTRTHFVRQYYSLRGGRPPKEFRAPQSAEEMTYEDFLQEASAAEHGPGQSGGRGLLYLTVSAGAGAQIDWIRAGLQFLLPSDEARAPGTGLAGHSFFDVDRHVNFHGINCRLGMRGIIQAAHYDSKRNFIAMVGGRKRYVIQPPSACEDLELLGPGDPSTRHASFNWADTQERERRRKSGFCSSPATEIVLKKGEVLYLPSYWFHYIISLGTTGQHVAVAPPPCLHTPTGLSHLEGASHVNPTRLPHPPPLSSHPRQVSPMQYAFGTGA